MVVSRRKIEGYSRSCRWFTCSCSASRQNITRRLSLKYCRENNKERIRGGEKKRKERKKNEKTATCATSFRILKEKYRWVTVSETIGGVRARRYATIAREIRVKEMGRGLEEKGWRGGVERGGTIASLGIQVSTTRSYFLNKHARGRIATGAARSLR